MTKTVGRKKKLPESKVATWTTSLLPELKEKFLSYIGNRNQSQFVREAVEEKMEREIKKAMKK